MKSLPLTPREIKATEAVLERVYNAARLGLKGDNLAANVGLLPVEYQRLRQFDPVVDMAELKGRADAERELSEVIHAAALSGDTKAAEMILKHKHGWVATQHIQVDTNQKISISAALEQAQSRVLDGLVTEATEGASAETHLLSGRRTDTDGEAVEPQSRGRPRGVRPVRVPVGASEHSAG